MKQLKEECLQFYSHKGTHKERDRENACIKDKSHCQSFEFEENMETYRVDTENTV